MELIRSLSENTPFEIVFPLIDPATRATPKSGIASTDCIFKAIVPSHFGGYLTYTSSQVGLFVLFNEIADGEYRMRLDLSFFTSTNDFDATRPTCITISPTASQFDPQRILIKDDILTSQKVDLKIRSLTAGIEGGPWGLNLTNMQIISSDRPAVNIIGNSGSAVKIIGNSEGVPAVSIAGNGGDAVRMSSEVASVLSMNGRGHAPTVYITGETNRSIPTMYITGNGGSAMFLSNAGSIDNPMSTVMVSNDGIGNGIDVTSLSGCGMNIRGTSAAVVLSGSGSRDLVTRELTSINTSIQNLNSLTLDTMIDGMRLGDLLSVQKAEVIGKYAITDVGDNKVVTYYRGDNTTESFVVRVTQTGREKI